MLLVLKGQSSVCGGGVKKMENAEVAGDTGNNQKKSLPLGDLADWHSAD
jgi:hypothetical protein